MRRTGILLLTLAFGGCASAPRPISVPESQPGPDWAVVTKLSIGTLIRVEDRDGRFDRGALAAVDLAGLRLLSEGDPIDVQRSSVRRLFLLGGHRTARGAGWGALIGAAVGATLVAIAAPEGRLGWIALVAPLWAGIGAGAGALVGTSIREQTLVYEASGP